MSRLAADALRKGDRAVFGPREELVTVLRAEMIGPTRWLHVERVADGGQWVTHPDHLTRVRPLIDVLREHVAAMGRAL